MRLRLLLSTMCFIVLTSACFAQDVIVTRDAKKINAKVMEVNAENIKYKLFEYQDGPTYTLPRSNIVSIIYQNGEVETFEIKTATPSTPARTTPMQTTPAQTTSIEPMSITAKQKPCAPKNAFGLDIGTGVLCDVDDPSFGGAIGFRYLHHFSPYFGIDFIKINTQVDFIYEDTYIVSGRKRLTL